MYSMVIKEYCNVYLKVTNRVNLEYFHHKKKIL